MRTSIAVLIAFAVPAVAQESKAPPAPPARVLPGLQRDGFVQLPNQWKLKAAGAHLDVGDFPVNIQFHPTGQFAAVLHNGYREHEIVMVSLAANARKIVSRTILPQSFTGLAFSPDGKQVYASGGEFDRVHVWDFDKGLLHNARTIGIEQEKGRMVAGGLALDAAGKDLFVTAVWGDAVVRIPLDNPENKTVIRLTGVATKPEKPQGDPPSPVDGRREIDETVAVDQGKAPAKNNSFPYTCLVEPNGKRLFVSLWANAKIAVVDLETNKVVAGWPTAEHPTELVLSPDAKTLYVSCANSTKVSVFDVAAGSAIQTIHCALYPQAPSGNTPNSLCLTPDGQMLFVANADANNLAVFNVTDPKAAKPLGFIPTGWYPTSVRYHAKEKTIYVANGKGRASKPNPSGANPENPRSTIEYIGSLYSGTVSAIPLPSPADMAKHSKVAFECSPLRPNAEARADAVEADNPIPRKAGEKSPIKHCIYIVKENRTYDQVFGDIPTGNGEPSLCLFPDKVTPNHHKLAREFVLLDNTYVEGEVSADGHEWTMGAYASDFVEKMWPLSYRGSPKGTFGYPSEGHMDGIARPAGGYLWDRCKAAGVSYRSYGEWIENGKKKPDGTFEDSRATVKALEGHFDPKFRGYDLDYTDVKRAERFIDELKRFERDGGFPQLTILRLPNDHTTGTRVGKPTPTAMVADNDLALGMVVEAVSRSKFWKETAIFVIEDDAQNGPDHVDAHRVTALVVSPWTKRKHVDSTMYSTSSMLRTMELILGLQPMSQFDAAARPMYRSFTAKADFAPYTHAPAGVDVNAVNRPEAFGAALSEKLDLAKEDQADDILFNEIIWKSVRGASSRMPAPVRAAFFLPVKAKKEQADD
jgi:DNA-binding beta-propeller fold protein YncE